MSRLEELIRELCPDGVEYRAIASVTTVGRGKRVVKSQLAETGTYPVFQNSLKPLGYYSESNLPGGIPFVIGAGAAGEIGFCEVDFWAADDCYFFEKNENVDSRFLYHVLLSQQQAILSKVRKASIPRLSRSVIENLVIPVPPLEVQREIVRILDNFTELTTELTTKLTAELTARKLQYEYYRSKLLERPEIHVDKVSIFSLGKWRGGKTPSMANKEYWDKGTIPWISSKDMKVPVLEDTEDHITEKALSEGGMTLLPKNTIAIVTRSGILKHTFPIAYVPFQTTVNQDIKALVVRDGVLPKYAFHVLQAYSEDIRKKTKKQGGTVDSLDFQKVLNYEVPLPTPEVQERLVEVLDNFETICSDLNIGLPDEIEARQKQYEYYRDKLLTFDMSEIIICRIESNRIESNRIESNRIESNRIESNRFGLIKLYQYVYGYVEVELREMVSVFRGEYITQKSMQAGDVPVILGGQEPAYYIDHANHTGEVIVIARSGASAGYVSYWDEPIFITDGFGYEPDKDWIIPRYLYYFLKNIEKRLNAMKRGAGVPHISGEALLSLKIIVPTLEEQRRLVTILDRFDTLCNDLTSGLPAEIEARRKQYEYYRDKLLIFKEKAV